jgi:hypothetical protein
MLPLSQIRDSTRLEIPSQPIALNNNQAIELTFIRVIKIPLESQDKNEIYEPAKDFTQPPLPFSFSTYRSSLT